MEGLRRLMSGMVAPNERVRKTAKRGRPAGLAPFRDVVMQQLIELVDALLQLLEIRE